MATTVTLQLNDIESSEAMSNLFNNLSQEDRVEIITKLIVQWFDKSSQVEEDVYGKAKLKEMMTETFFSGKPRYTSEEQAKASEEYRRYVGGLKNLKIDVGERIFKELRLSVEESVSNFISNSDKCNRIIETIIENLVKNIDTFFMKALMRQFVNGIDFELQNVMNSANFDYDLTSKVREILQDNGM